MKLFVYSILLEAYAIHHSLYEPPSHPHPIFAEFDGGGNNNNNGNYNYNNGNNNDVNRYQQYFAGAYCDTSDGKSIHLGLFLDAGCTTKAKTGTFKALTYGQELPYETTPMITSECVSCLQVDQDANNNNNNNNQNNNNNNNNSKSCL